MNSPALLLSLTLMPGCGVGMFAGVLFRDAFVDGPVRFDTGGDTDGDVTPDTAFDSGEWCFGSSPDIDAATYNCDAVGYWFDVFALGLVSGAALHIAGPGGEPTEIGHAFWATEPFSSAPDNDTRGFYDDVGGCWDNPYVELNTVSDSSDVVLGETTIFDCQNEAALTFSVVVYDLSGAQADCGSWGADPTGSFGGWDFGACGLL